MDLGSFFGVDDMSIIKEYLMQPEIIDKAPQLIVDVMQEKINEYARLRRMQLRGESNRLVSTMTTFLGILLPSSYL